jgi:hypothetical protein
MTTTISAEFGDRVRSVLAELPKSTLVDRSDLNALLGGLCGQN